MGENRGLEHSGPENSRPEHRGLDASGRDVPGLIGCLLAVALGIAAIATSGDFSPLGAVFPRAISALMIVFGLAYVVIALRRPLPKPSAAPGSALRRIGTVAVMLAWAFALQPVGFLTSSVCASAALLLLAQHDRWTVRTALLYALATSLVVGGLYALFRFVLQVPLPVGLFW